MRSFFGLLLAVLLVAGLTNRADAVLATFDSPVTLGTSQAPGVWYTDRYAPAGFVSPVSFDGDNRLQQSISAADGANSRPGSFSSTFYNTQGRKYDLDIDTAKLSIDLYIADGWQSTGNRMAGLWGTGFDAGNSVSAYPIIEFTSDSATPRFRSYDVNTGDWMDMGLPSGFAYDAWYTLEIDLSGGQVNYTVGDLSNSVASPSTAYIGNTILQGYNTADGVSYDIYWDNLSVAAVPEPTAALFGTLMASGLGITIARRRRDADEIA